MKIQLKIIIDSKVDPPLNFGTRIYSFYRNLEKIGSDPPLDKIFSNPPLDKTAYTDTYLLSEIIIDY